MEPLEDIDVRVLGALIEKEITTPDHYPLSLNALTAACNQTSNRHPVVAYLENTVSISVNRLRVKSLVRGIQRADSRVMKFQELLTEKMNLSPRDVAVMCTLMLRGPQTAGEIKTRGARLAEFDTLADVEATLEMLIGRHPALVARLPRQPGQKEVRYAHLLAGEVAYDTPDPAPAVASSAPAAADRIAALEETVTELKSEVADLRRQLDDFRKQFE